MHVENWRKTSLLFPALPCEHRAANLQRATLYHVVDPGARTTKWEGIQLIQTESNTM